MLAHVETNQCTCCNVISHALCHALTYPAATQNDVDALLNVYINYNACANACAYVYWH